MSIGGGAARDQTARSGVTEMNEADRCELRRFGVCRGDRDGRRAGGTAAGPAPTAGNLRTPPPAWVETARGSRWLGYSSFCWASGCADYTRPRCGDGHTPTLRLRSGERVIFHLGFAPRASASFPFLPTAVTTSSLNAPWRGVSRKRARSHSSFGQKNRGDASYVACVGFT